MKRGIALTQILLLDPLTRVILSVICPGICSARSN
jgi:hypothetical protein